MTTPIVLIRSVAAAVTMLSLLALGADLAQVAYQAAHTAHVVVLAA